MRIPEDLWSTLLKFVWIVILVLVVIGVLISFWLVANKRDYSSLEVFFLQVFVSFVGIVGSFFSGRQSAREAAKVIVKTHAKPAFRHLLSLRSGLSSLTFILGASQGTVSLEEYREIIAKLDGIVRMLHLMVVDALGGWEDIVPEEVEKLQERVYAEKSLEDEQ